MRSNVIDQLLSGFLDLSVRASWAEGVPSLSDAHIRGAEIEIDSVQTDWIEIDRIGLHAERLRIVPGVPPLLELEDVRIRITTSESAVKKALQGVRLPFEPHFEPNGIRLATDVAGLPISSFAAKLDIVDGWFVLRPRHSKVLGLSAPLLALFHWYLPLPPLPAGTRLSAIDHAARQLTLTFRLEDLSEEIRPDLIERLRKRLLPGSAWAR